jgi:hypothetical protein
VVDRRLLTRVRPESYLKAVAWKKRRRWKMTSALIYIEEFIMLGDESGWRRIASSDGFSFLQF